MHAPARQCRRLVAGCWVLGVECDLALAAGGGPAVALELVAFELVAVAVCAPSLMTHS